MSRTRRWMLQSTAAVTLAPLLTGSREALADEGMPVPAALHAELFTKLAKYDRNMDERGAPPLRLYVLQNGDNARSDRAAVQLQNALANVGAVGSKSLQVRRAVYTSPNDLRAFVRERAAHMVYLAAGLEPMAEDIAGALGSVSVLSGGANRVLASKGAVVGFDLNGGRPVILVHRARAAAQRVDLSSQLLKLAQVIG